MPTQYIRGANRTAQWYQDSYPGASFFSRIDKFLLHTTETEGWPGYGGGASAPNATYFPERREIRQHFGINRSSRALRDPSSTVVRENRDNVFQLEIVCYSDFILAERVEGLWVGELTATHMRDIAAIALQCHRDWGLPLQSSVRWREGRQGYYNDVRLSGREYDSYRGILGHVHASGQSHWNPGGFRYSQLETAMGWQFANHPVYGGGVSFPDPDVPPVDLDPKEWWEMPIPDSELDRIAEAVKRALLDDAQVDGQNNADGSEPTVRQVLGRIDKRTYNAPDEVAARVHEMAVQVGTGKEALGLAVGRTRAAVKRMEDAQGNESTDAPA